MKAKYLWGILVTLFFFGCDDNTGSLGLEMLPGSDNLEVKKNVYNVKTQSILSGPVFAKTSIGYVGKFTDPDFGFYETGFLTQLNCTENLRFPDVYDPVAKTGLMTGDSILQVELVLYYDKYFGDSLNACRMSVYELNKRLEKNHYTDINPEEYYDKNDILGRKAYTAVDLSISDSARNVSSFKNYVRFALPKDFGEEILRLNREHPEYFKDADSFIDNVFKGLYIKSDYGDGTILYIDEVNLNIIYPCFGLDSIGNILPNYDETKDSVYYSAQTFAATKEVIQANRFNIEPEQLKEKVEEDEWTYIKSPAGIFTQMTLPVQEIYNDLHADTLNSVKLTFTAYQQKNSGKVDETFHMSPPAEILLVQEKEWKTFFESNSLYNNTTSYISGFSATTNQYDFPNVTRLINSCIAQKEAVRKEEGKNWTAEEWAKWEEDNKWGSIVLIPVITTTSSDESTILSIQNDMKPAYVKLKGGAKVGNELDMEVYYTVFYD